MLPLIGTVFVASLFGSLHCVGMCGPLAMLASSHSSARKNHRSVNLAAVIAYHASRILAYAMAGALVGLIGAGIQETGSLLGLQRLAARLAGGSMLVIGSCRLRDWPVARCMPPGYQPGSIDAWLPVINGRGSNRP